MCTAKVYDFSNTPLIQLQYLLVMSHKLQRLTLNEIVYVN